MHGNNKESHPTRRPSQLPADYSLDAIISQYGDKPELLQLVLMSKVQEDRRRAEEAKLRSKEIDYYLKHSDRAFQFGDAHVHPSQAHELSPSQRRPSFELSTDAKPFHGHDGMAPPPAALEPVTLPGLQRSHANATSSLSLPPIYSLAQHDTLPAIALPPKTSVHSHRMETELSDRSSPPNTLLLLPQTPVVSHKSSSSISSIDSPRSLPDTPITSRPKEPPFNTLSNFPALESRMPSLRTPSFSRPAGSPLLPRSPRPVTSNEPHHPTQETLKRNQDQFYSNQQTTVDQSSVHPIHNKIPIMPIHHVPSGNPQTTDQIKPGMKRRRREMQAISMIIETREFPYNDDYLWKNNGNTIHKGSGNKSIYYKCANNSKGCSVNKTVTFKDNGEYIIKYRGKHLQDCNRIKRVIDV